MIRLAWFSMLMLTGFMSPAFSDQPAAEPLHQRVDRLVDGMSIGPLVPLCGDFEFVRRIHLDLTGVIPSPSAVQEFVADNAHNSVTRRSQLIDRLLASPEFVRHLATQLDVMLLERRSDKYVSDIEWETYLLNSIAADKPLDQLYRELIFPDDARETVSAAARFLLNREAEPNAVTRDIGRLAFGVDLQCAQCHDHPLIGDYFQSDYFGLYSFVQRTGLYTDPGSKKVRLSEKPDGEAKFTSVFTGEGRDWTRPRLPKGRSLLDEPTFADGDQYLIAPKKDVPGRPKFSRRGALAEMLADNQYFRRNLANRLWAIMFGRGLVHPLDVHHAANPPTNPELLTLLAESLVAENFHLRSFLRQLAMTRAYQRTSQPPSPDRVNIADIAARREQLLRQYKTTEDGIESLRQTLRHAESALAAAIKQDLEQRPALTASEQKIAASRKLLTEAADRLKQVEAAVTLAEQQFVLLTEAANQLRQSASRLPDETLLGDAASLLEQRVQQTDAMLQGSRQAGAEHLETVNGLRDQLQNEQQQHAELVVEGLSPERLAELEVAESVAARCLEDAQMRLRTLEAQLQTCQLVTDYDAVRYADPEQAGVLWQSLVDRWTTVAQIAPLKPLSPEQLATSAMRATGVLEPQIAGLQAKLDETPPTIPEGATDSDRQRIQTVARQSQVMNQIRSTTRQFVSVFGSAPTDEFQATVNQALFLGNSDLVNGWLSVSGNQLAAQLAQITDNQSLVNQLYLTVLSRPADDSEARLMMDVLCGSADDRDQAICELIWALLSSNEFRFNY